MKFSIFSIFKKSFISGQSYISPSFAKISHALQKYSIIVFSKNKMSGIVPEKLYLVQSGESRNSLDPTDLELILYEVQELIKKKDYLFIINDLNHLIKSNNFQKVLHFILNLKDIISSSGSILVLLYDKDSIDKKNMNILLKEFKRI